MRGTPPIATTLISRTFPLDDLSSNKTDPSAVNCTELTVPMAVIQITSPPDVDTIPTRRSVGVSINERIRSPLNGRGGFQRTALRSKGNPPVVVRDNRS